MADGGGTSSTLTVTLQNVTFFKEARWFIAVQLIGLVPAKKFRTDASSSPSKNPIFQTKKFEIPLPSSATLSTYSLKIQACEVAEGDKLVATEVGEAVLSNFGSLLLSSSSNNKRASETLVLRPMAGAVGDDVASVTLDITLANAGDDDGGFVTPPKTPQPVDFGDVSPRDDAAAEEEQRQLKLDTEKMMSRALKSKNKSNGNDDDDDDDGSGKNGKKKRRNVPLRTRDLSVCVLRGYNLPLEKLPPRKDRFRDKSEEAQLVPPSCFLKLKSGDSISMTKIVQATRHPMWDQFLSIEALRPLEKEEISSLDTWIGSKGDVTVLKSRIPWSVLPVDQPHVISIPLNVQGLRLTTILQANSTVAEQYEHFLDSSKHVMLQVELDNNPFPMDGVVAVIRLVDGDTQVTVDSDVASDLEVIDMGLPGDTMSIEPLKEAVTATEEARQDGLPPYRITMLPSKEDAGGAGRSSVTFCPDGIGTKKLAIEFFRPNDAEMEEGNEFEPDVRDYLMMFVGSCIVPLDDLIAVSPDPTTRCHVVSTVSNIRISEVNGDLWFSNRRKPSKLGVTLRMWDNEASVYNLQQKMTIDQKRHKSFKKFVENLKNKINMIDVDDGLVAKRTFKSAPVTPFVNDLSISASANRPATQTLSKSRFLVQPEPKKRPTTSEVSLLIENALKEANAGFSKEREQLVATLKLLREDVGAKAKQIERSVHDIDQRNDALRKCAVEIMELRQHNKQILSDKSLLQKELMEKRAIEEEFDSSTLETLDRAEIIERLRDMTVSYKKQQINYNELLQRMQQLHKKYLAASALKERYTKLSDAHQVQATKMQQLVDENTKLKKYVKASKNQEQVIEKLEDLMETTLMQNRSLEQEKQQLKEIIQKMKKEQEDVQNSVEKAANQKIEAWKLEREEERAGYETQLQQLKNQVDSNSNQQPLQPKQQQPPPTQQQQPSKAPDSWQKEELQMRMRAEKAETRVKMINKQMITNAEKFNKQILELKAQIEVKDAEIEELKRKLK